MSITKYDFKFEKGDILSVNRVLDGSTKLYLVLDRGYDDTYYPLYQLKILTNDAPLPVVHSADHIERETTKVA